ncbi:MAG: GAF domain-containing protein [Cyanobacteria bacterium Co-bin13]|nr:GAF domain-containing protein [Cyanobacteria bacterium Co-bin13]
MLSLDVDRFLDPICAKNTPEAIFTALMPALGEQLGCDRTFLYLRSPQHRIGRVPFCWRRSEGIPEVYDPDWKPEPPSLVKEDPMFAAAVRAEPSIFVDDVETASPEVLDPAFEAKTFGHRALIHAHLRQDGELWGILQPAVFGRPQFWTQAEQTLIETTVTRLTPVAIAYVAEHFNPNHFEKASYDR